MKKWIVILRGRVIDEVYFTRDCDAAWVRRALIEHDGYSNNITVRAA